MADDRPSTNYYGIVIDALRPDITPTTLKPKVIQQSDTGHQLFYSNGSPQLEIYTPEKYGQIQDNLINQWPTPLELYNKMEPTTKQQINSTKNSSINTK